MQLINPQYIFHILILIFKILEDKFLFLLSFLTLLHPFLYIREHKIRFLHFFLVVLCLYFNFDFLK